MTLQPNDVILNNKYRIDALIGAGAFGEVYRATHLALQAPRALKILRRDAPGVGSTEFADYAQRFQLEAQLGAQLNNQPHIIQVHDFERDGEMLILVMEYASGGSLADRIDQARKSGQPIPIDEAIRIALEVADGLAAIHALDAVHRDLKPSNILFDAQGRAKIADLGLAQIPGGPSMRSRLSQSVPHPGTPAYMSPEQRDTSDHLAPATDVYSLGAVLFEMLTGRLWRNIKPGTQAKTLRADTPEWLDRLLLKLLAKDIDSRPWDGSEVTKLLHDGRQVQETYFLREPQEAEKFESTVNREGEVRDPREAESKRWPLVATHASREFVLTLAPGVEMIFARIPAGEFLMGSTEWPAEQNERPPHKVFLDEYLIGKYPVTVAHYAAFVNATHHRTAVEQNGSGYLLTGWYMHDRRWEKTEGVSWQRPHGHNDELAEKSNDPVTLIAWDDAMAFCEWVTGQTGVKVRLPTEAEWEKAARGSDGRMYPWGNAEPTEQLCNFNTNIMDTTPVGQYSPQGDSPYGCADMAGNVLEWVADWYGEKYYTRSLSRNPPGPLNGQGRVLRGGSWASSAQYVRAASRRYWGADYFYADSGFRCACDFPVEADKQP